MDAAERCADGRRDRNCGLSQRPKRSNTPFIPHPIFGLVRHVPALTESNQSALGPPHRPGSSAVTTSVFSIRVHTILISVLGFSRCRCSAHPLKYSSHGLLHLSAPILRSFWSFFVGVSILRLREVEFEFDALDRCHGAWRAQRPCRIRRGHQRGGKLVQNQRRGRMRK